jgi:aspartate kinase
MPGLRAITISCDGLNNLVGAGAEVLSQFAREKVPYDHTPTGVDEMSVVFRKSYFENREQDQYEIIKGIESFFHSEIPDAAPKISIKDGLGALVVAGKGLEGSIGISAKIQGCIADAGINLKFIDQAPSERCIIYGVEEKDGENAVRAVYDKFLR